MSGILRGRVLGADRQELLEKAESLAATYFKVQPVDLRVSLSGQTYAPRQGAGVNDRDPRFAADFLAEVK